MLPFLVLTLVLSISGTPEIPVGGKIIGGQSTTIEEYPYQASLHAHDIFICGGSIITHLHVITAAHCTDRQSVGKLSVRVASNTTNQGGQKIKIKRYIQHSKYNKTNFDNDIAVLELKEAIILAPAKTILLPPKDFKYSVNAVGTVTGWGVLTEGSLRHSESLRVVQVSIIDTKECSQLYENKFGVRIITERMICAYEPSKDSCQGDSGGPLVIDGVLAGIVSSGYGCARTDFPGVYTKVSEFLDDINKIVGK